MLSLCMQTLIELDLEITSKKVQDVVLYTRGRSSFVFPHGRNGVCVLHVVVTFMA
jgi:hypothetical protein